MKISLSDNIITNFLWDIFLPQKCLNCQKKNEALCNQCLLRIKKAEKTETENIWAIFDYKDPIIKKAIWQLKYYKRKYLGKKLGQILFTFMNENLLEFILPNSTKPIFIIPVPISKERRKTRGYNQSLVLAKEFCRGVDKKIFKLKSDLIYKKINTIPQAQITNRQKRLKNIKGVFIIRNKKIIKDHNFIIIDDVTTTGGTIVEIIKILKKAGAKKVIGLTLAH